MKGRDWYDFLWYVSTKTNINLPYLKATLVQTGHFPAEEIFTKEILISLLERAIKAIDWKKASADVEPLVTSKDLELVRAWNQTFFMAYVQKLAVYLKNLNPIELL